MARADITPADVQALRDEITTLMARADITPADVQALRDEIMTLMARADITPADEKALRDQVDMLMLRATISKADYDALVAALGDMPLTVATLEMLVDDYNKNKSAKVDEAAAEASARALGLLAKIKAPN